MEPVAAAGLHRCPPWVGGRPGAACRNLRRVSTGPATPPTLATLSASRLRREAVVRWLRPLAPAFLLVVVWSAFYTEPAPGPAGRGLAVSIALGGLILGGVGVLWTLRRP